MCSGSFEHYVSRNEPLPKHRKPKPLEQRRVERIVSREEPKKKCS